MGSRILEKHRCTIDFKVVFRETRRNSKRRGPNLNEYMTTIDFVLSQSDQLLFRKREKTVKNAVFRVSPERVSFQKSRIFSQANRSFLIRIQNK